MANKITQWFSGLGDQIAEQVWFQQAKAKWEELDPQSRMYLKIATAAGSALVLGFLVFSSLWSIHKLKTEINEKSDLVNLVQSATEEKRRLADSTSGASSAAASDPLPTYLEGVAATQGIGKESLTLSEPKAGASDDTAKESLAEITLKHVNLRQVLRLAHALENGARPIKLRNLVIDTKADPAGYLDATLSISGFVLANPTGSGR